MKNNKDTNLADRRALMGGLGVAALAGVALGSTPSKAQAQDNKFTPKRHALDSWMEEISGFHRVFIDTDNIAGGTNALRYGTNILNAHVNAYEGSDDEMAMIICYRHASTPLGYNDAMWEKYGSTFSFMASMGSGQAADPEAETPTVNPQTTSIDDMVGRGVHFAICGTASRGMAGMIARQSGSTAEEVFAELEANTIANAHIVPAGVMAVTRAQEYGYSLLYSAS